jgi:THUMP domain-like/Conserved hypothetical protein 95
MYFNSLLQPEVQDFIREKTGENVSKLAFLKNPFPSIEYAALLNQIECRTKCQKKLTTWFTSKNVIYPPKISIEQTSSEITARYKSELVSGNTIIDLTGGFGVDDYYFSKILKQVIHCEINEELSQIVAHNFKSLEIENVVCVSGDSHETLKKRNQKFDWIYIDPSRRNDAKGKVFLLADCLPNVPDSLDYYFEWTDSILIKTAPILDITAGLAELKNVKEIHVVAVDNEVKELLWILSKNTAEVIKIKAVNLTKTGDEHFEFSLDSEPNATYHLPQKFLYEPNSAIMKSGGFGYVCNPFEVSKLHQHSHLYTSNELIEFPGRIFEIKSCLEYSKNVIKERIEKTTANVTVRNFPETVDIIRKKWKILDGGLNYYFFTTDKNNRKIVLLCTKIN